MKLRYWVAVHRYDSQCYSLIGKTKKSVIEQLNALDERDRDNYDPPELRVLYYKDAFDLLDILTCEGGGRGSGFDRELPEDK